MFKVTDRIQMKHNLRKIDTYGISPLILKHHKKTIFIVRKTHDDETGQYAIRVYKRCKVYNRKKKQYKPFDCDFHLAYWNPEMFELVKESDYDN